MNKKIVSLMLVLMMLICSAGSIAIAQDDGLALPEVGACIQGFTVLDVQPLGLRDMTMVYMEHEKTGAKLIYGACDDLERGFSVAFRTPAINDMGMPHVFEHSCLSGSEKYPDPSLFFSMMSQTYITFLNALTYPTVTIYPVASPSEEQLAKNIDYNLNGVFKPLVLTDERSMMREAYRYELADKDSDITLNGTVYSEMKGAYTLSSAALYNTMKLMYPGSYTANVSGGKPDDIPQMTQQDLIDFHSSYYHPSNALFTLHGKLDLNRFLGQIDEFISQYDRKEINLEDTGYTPQTGYREQIVPFAVAADSSAMTSAYYAYALPGITPEEVQLLSFAGAMLVMNGGPIADLAKERMPGAMIGIDLLSHTVSDTLVFICNNLTEEQLPVFKSVIEDGIAMALRDGFNREKMISACKLMEYSNFDASQSTTFGQEFVKSVPRAWGNDGDVYEFSRLQQAQLNLHDAVASGAVGAVFVKYLSAPENRVMCATVPEPGALEKKDAELEQSLKGMKAAMSDAEIDALVDRTADFAAWTEANAKSSMIDQMKAVNVHDLPEELQRYYAEDTTIDGMRVVSSAISSDEIVDIKLLFDASTVPEDALYNYMLASTLLKSMPTENYTTTELSNALTDCTNALTFSPAVLTFNDDESYTAVFEVSWRTTRTDLQKSFDMVQELLFNTDWANISEMRRLIDQNVMMDRMLIASMPDLLASTTMEAYLTDSKSYSYHLSGFDYLKRVSSLVQLSDEALADEAVKLRSALEYVLNRNGFILTCVGSEEAIAEVKTCGAAFYEKLDAVKHAAVDYTKVFSRLEKPMALTIDGDMQYNCIGINLRDYGINKDLKDYVIADIVLSKILLPNLRFIGGAYGVTCQYSYPMFSISSFRDPNLASSYEYYRRLGDDLRALEITQEDIDGFIAPYFSRLSRAFTPTSGAKCAITDIITGNDTFSMYLDVMHEIKQITPEDVAAFADMFDLLAEHGSVLTVGGAAPIEQNRGMFDIVNTYYVD